LANFRSEVNFFRAVINRNLQIVILCNLSSVFAVKLPFSAAGMRASGVKMNGHKKPSGESQLKNTLENISSRD